MEPTPLKLELVDIDDAAKDPADAAPPASPDREGGADEDVTVSPAMAPKEAATIDLKPLGRPVPQAPATPVKIDTYAQQAAREYAQGHVDQPLWDRALTQAGGDKTAAAAIYVRARGTALRLLDRHRDLDATRPLPPPPAVQTPASRRKGARASPPRYVIPAIAAGVLLLAGAGSAFYFLAGDNPAPVAATRPATPAPTASVPAAAPAAPVAAAAVPPLAAPVARSDAGNSLAALQAKIQELRDAGNWNVLVLYAVEWTRREPDNAAAWNQLRAGYVYLRQYDDALAAAKKAVQLAPNDAVMWRRLGEVNLDLDDSAGALLAFKEAAARDAGDIASLQAMGLLATRLGQPQEAKAAFDRALAAQPGDGVTTCLRNGAAQLPAARDAYTAYRQVSALEAKCRGRGEGTAVAAK